LSYLRAQGLLPIGENAGLTLQSCQSDVETIYHQVQPLMAYKQEDLEINLSLSLDKKTIQLQGWLNHLYAKTKDSPNIYLVREHIGKRKSQQMIKTWIEHLIFCAQSGANNAQTYLICTDKTTRFTAVEPHEAQQRLIQWIGLMQKGLDQPLVFFPKTLWAILMQHFDEEKGWDLTSLEEEETGKFPISSDIEKAFSGEYRPYGNIPGEKEDPYIKRLWTQLSDDMLKEMDKYAIDYLYPMQPYIEDVEESY